MDVGKICTRKGSLDISNYIAIVILEEGLGLDSPTQAQIDYIDALVSIVLTKRKQKILQKRLDQILHKSIKNEERYNLESNSHVFMNSQA